MWETLAAPWQAALAEAWAAYGAGSIPIGAVVTDAAGQVLAYGRNHIEDDDAAAPTRRNPLAHAELNALLVLPPYNGRDEPAYTLYSTMEPCPLCLGAFYMSGVRTLRYAARDPYAGSVNLLGATPYLSRKPIRVFPPEQPELETLSVGLLLAHLLETSRRDMTGWITTWWEPVVPAGVRLGRRLHAAGRLPQLRAAGVSAPEMARSLSAEAR